MTTRTQSDLVTKILEKLFVVPEGQAPEIEDSARVESNIGSVLSALARREIVYVSDIANIDDALFLDLAKVCAYEMRDEFGITGEQLDACKLANAEGIANLKVMMRGRPTYEPQRSVYF